MIENVAIIGAGPYGLSIAAHLSARGIKARIFGYPMQTWATGVPQGMLLKSEGFASCLSEPSGRFTLAAFCRDNQIPYADIGVPVAVETFVAYGQAFQKRLVPELEQQNVVNLTQTAQGFALQLEDGEMLVARRVVLATGIGHFAQVPPELASLPPGFVTHSSRHSDFSQFRDRSVTVIGAGASALDVAAALRRAGARPTLVTRQKAVRFYAPQGVRQWLDAIRAPMTPLGPGWKKYLCVHAPSVFHRLPEALRVNVVKRYLGPAPGWSVRDTVEGHVPFVLNARLTEARLLNGQVGVDIVQVDGTQRQILADHVIAATGYRVDLSRLAFLDRLWQDKVRCAGGSPALSLNFESSVPGLYFVGTPSATSFGPMLRFVCGSEFTARRLSARLASESLTRRFVRLTRIRAGESAMANS